MSDMTLLPIYFRRHPGLCFKKYFLDDRGNPVMEIDRFIDNTAKTALPDIKRVLATVSDPSEKVTKKVYYMYSAI